MSDEAHRSQYGVFADNMVELLPTAARIALPLYYENRGGRILDIHNSDITDKILDTIEEADLDAEQTEKAEREFEKEIYLLTAEPRLRSRQTVLQKARAVD